MKVITKALVAIATITMTATVAQAASPSLQKKMAGGKTYVGGRLNNVYVGGLGGTIYGGYEIMPNTSVELEVAPSIGSGVTVIGLSATAAYRYPLEPVIQVPVYVKGKAGVGAVYARAGGLTGGTGFGGVALGWGLGVGYDISPSLSVELDANTITAGLGVHKKF